MKEAYAVRRTVPPSAEIQASIDKLLSEGMVDDPQKMLSELARLGARLIRRAVEEEFETWLGRARYERRPDRPRGLRSYESGLRTGSGLGMCRRLRVSCGSRSRRQGTSTGASPLLAACEAHERACKIASLCRQNAPR